MTCTYHKGNFVVKFLVQFPFILAFKNKQKIDLILLRQICSFLSFSNTYSKLEYNLAVCVKTNLSLTV